MIPDTLSSPVADPTLAPLQVVFVDSTLPQWRDLLRDVPEQIDDAGGFGKHHFFIF